MTDHYQIETLCNELLEQKKAHDKLVMALTKQIGSLESRLSDSEEDAYEYYSHVVSACRKPSLVDFVIGVYRRSPSSAKRIVAAIHDDTFDLSTIECSGDDFKPWPTA